MGCRRLGKKGENRLRLDEGALYPAHNYTYNNSMNYINTEADYRDKNTGI